jgi:CBS-domain-containing membrane protein
VNSIDPRTALFRAVGGAGAIALMIWLSKTSGVPLMWIPFATSIVMVMGSPEAPPAQPLRILGGHMVCAAAGVACTMLLGFDIWIAAIGIGVSIAIMHMLDVFHPPAGISPVIIVMSKASPLFILSPVLAGAILLILYALIFHRLTGNKWPENWR